MRQAGVGAGWRGAVARIAYLFAVAAVGLHVLYRIDEVLRQPATAAFLGVLGLAFLGLAWRPYAWGKLLAVVVGVAWALPGVMNQVDFGPTLSLYLVTGVMVLAAGLAHHLAGLRARAGTSV